MEEIQYKVIFAERKTYQIKVIAPFQIEIRVPRRLRYRGGDSIEYIIKKREKWILEVSRRMQEEQSKQVGDPKDKKIHEMELRKQAQSYMPERVRYFEQRMNVTCNRVSIRNQKTRWGSCSSKQNINLNCRLMLAPPEIIDYVIVHELSHLLHMNHSRQFWQTVEMELPDYKESRRWLRIHENELRI